MYLLYKQIYSSIRWITELAQIIIVIPILSFGVCVNSSCSLAIFASVRSDARANSA